MTYLQREAVGVSAQERFAAYMGSRGFEIVPNGQENRLTPDQRAFVGSFDDPLSLSLRFAEDLIMFRRVPPFAPALFEVKAQLRPSPNFAIDQAEWLEVQKRAFLYRRVAIAGGVAKPRGLYWYAAWVIDLPDFLVHQGSGRGSGRPFVLVPIDRMFPIQEFLQKE